MSNKLKEIITWILLGAGIVVIILGIIGIIFSL